MLEATAHEHPPPILFSQQKKSSKYNTLQKTPIFQPFFDISNGLRDLGDFMLEATAYAHQGGSKKNELF